MTVRELLYFIVENKIELEDEVLVDDYSVYQAEYVSEKAGRKRSLLILSDN